MTQICITIKSFEWYHIKNTIIFIKTIQTLLKSEKKIKFAFASKANPRLTSLIAQQSYNSKLPQVTGYQKENFNQITLPKKRKLFTVLRSPHIDKKSREQFEFIYYTKKLFIQNKNINNSALLIFFLKNSEFPGVEIEISLSYNSCLNFL